MTESFEDKFKTELYKKHEVIKKIFIPKEQYFQIIENVKAAAAKTTAKTRQEYYLLQKYEVLQCGDVEKLMKRRSNPEQQPMYYVSIEDTYDVIKRAHIATGHGGRDRMVKEIGKKYVNVTRDAIELFKSYCHECQKHKRPRTKGVVVRPILTNEFASRAQVDLIDMQSMSQHAFKWIMVYQDHLTKFVILRALTSKRAAEVAHNLLDIFLLIGAPSILQSDNGTEFTAEVITELKLFWPRLVMVHGKPRHPQSQGSVERANGDIKDMLVAWMGDNDTNDWSIGIKFVQFQKNSSFHSGIGRAPYTAMFGCDAKVGLTTSSLPQEIIQRMQTEDDLLAAINAEQPIDLQDDSAVTNDEVFPAVTNDEVLPSASASAPDVTIISDPVLTEDEHPANLIASRIDMIRTERSASRSAQLQQAERMVKRSRLELAAGMPGDNVAIPIPLVDRGRGDPRNILGVIVDRDQNDMYKVSVKSGILKARFSRNQFDLCPQKLLKESDVNCTKEVSLRQAGTKESKSGGQGFVRCNCAGNRLCESNRCKCYKSKIKCSSRCHSCLDCKNK